jgi:hypothetical protein
MKKKTTTIAPIATNNYHNSLFWHMSTTIGVKSWRGALILESARFNQVSDRWVLLSGVMWHRGCDGGREPLGHTLGGWFKLEKRVSVGLSSSSPSAPASSLLLHCRRRRSPALGAHFRHGFVGRRGGVLSSDELPWQRCESSHPYLSEI